MIMYNWIDFPYTTTDKESLKGDYLYAVGGYHSYDNGCPSWGTAESKKARFIGDYMGDLVISYADGEVNKLPLIFGYTLWYHSIWNEHPAPFFGEEADENLINALQTALAVYGGWEGDAKGVIRVALKDKPIQSVSVVPSTEKEGTPLFCGGYIVNDEETVILQGGGIDVDVSAPFFAAHTVNAEDPYPTACRKALEQVNLALHTYDTDFESAPHPFVFPVVSDACRVIFTGDPLASIATGVVYHNMKNLLERTDADGFIHTSYHDAPSWRYDGFGPYVAKANSYNDSFYSRDGARAIQTLNSFGYVTEAEKGCEFGNKCMMYFPEQGLKIKGVDIPGHYTVIPNKPLIYSTFLVDAANWPTKYTEDAFGEGYQNLGNQETDGHGLMMVANYVIWKQLGRKAEWVEKNWKYINEGAAWILWCHKYPELSFARDGLLYGETEAAMNDWTLYANVPCYLGLSCYAQMAEAAGHAAEASLWHEHAEIIRTQIDKQLTVGDGWDMDHKGFHHDPVPTMLSDIFGYDSADMPADWVSRSKVVYDGDVSKARACGYYGHGGGIGYDHAMITQNALLLDRMEDGSNFVKTLSKICFAPRLPESYLVPEAICVDAQKGVLRREGDLGNLVQLAEAMKCYLLVMGISPLIGKTLKIMPRLPYGWGVSVADFSIQNTNATVTMTVSAPHNGTQTATVHFKGEVPAEKMAFRFGPFSTDLTEAQVTLNGETVTCPLVRSGDSCWAWIEKELKYFAEVEQ